MRVAVLGSTGFLGEQILTVLSQERDYRVVLLSGYRNTDKLLHQARIFQPRYLFSPYLGKKERQTFHREPELISDIRILKEVLLSEEVEGVFFATGGALFRTARHPKMAVGRE